LERVKCGGEEAKEAKDVEEARETEEVEEAKEGEEETETAGNCLV
jgi:hypothetical protein